jgi:homoserine kinase
MVRGQPITPAQKRRLVSKIRALRTAETELDAYVLELSEAGVSVVSMMDASGEKGTETHVPHSTLHRWVQRAREANPHPEPATESPS